MRIFRFNSADRFLDFINPLNKQWETGGSIQAANFSGSFGWIFRGHDSTKYPITASAFRAGKLDDFVFWHKISDAKNKMYVERHTVSEQIAVKNFLLAADEFGLTNFLQHDTGKKIGDYIGKVNVAIRSNLPLKGAFPPPYLMEAFGLAQHHGIPTRLLDWTTSAYIATYFAAKTALYDQMNNDPDDYIAIWALDTKQFEINETTDERIMMLRVPNSGNQFLKHQQGLFLYDKLANQYHRQMKKWPTLDSALKTYWNRKFGSSKYGMNMPFFKIELSIKTCGVGLHFGGNSQVILLPHYIPSIRKHCIP